MKILQVCPSHLSDVATLPLKSKKSFSTSQKKTNCSPLAQMTPPENVTTLTRELLNFFIWLKRLVALFQTSKAVKTASCGLSSVALKESVVMCGNWKVRHASVQNDHLCVITCFQSFSTLISRIIHYAVLKFSPCRNKPLPQASTCPYQYMRSSDAVLGLRRLNNGK